MTVQLKAQIQHISLLSVNPLEIHPIAFWMVPFTAPTTFNNSDRFTKPCFFGWWWWWWWITLALMMMKQVCKEQAIYKS